jgi:hypothetical protein
MQSVNDNLKKGIEKLTTAADIAAQPIMKYATRTAKDMMNNMSDQKLPLSDSSLPVSEKTLISCPNMYAIRG